MGRHKVVVNKDLLAASIKEAEKDGPLPNQSILQQKIAEIYNAKKDAAQEEIKASHVYLRIQEFGLTVTTPKGKKGSAAGFTSGPRGPIVRTPKAEKFAADKEVVQKFQDLYKDTPERFQPVLERARKGSRTAAAKLKCLECCSWQTSEVAKCQVTCFLWPFRPYKSKGDAAADADPNAAVEVEEVPETEETEV